MARTGRSGERDAALALSEILGGLPLAHEQAAARYCIRRLSQTIRGSALEAVGRRRGCTGRLSRSFDGSLDVCARDRVHRAALARADPAVPNSPRRAKSSASSLTSDLAGDGLNEAVACIRTARSRIDFRRAQSQRHNRLRLLAPSGASGCNDGARCRGPDGPSTEAEGMASVYPRGVERDLSTWPKARRLDVIALALVDQGVAFADGAESAAV